MSSVSLVGSKRLSTLVSVLSSGLFRFGPLLPIIIPVLVNLWIGSVDRSAVQLQTWNHTYDYIIVGAGASGSALAYRLAQTKYRILVLEAGGNENYFSEIPALSHVLMKTRMDWQYETEPQSDACLGLVDQRSQWPAGRVLGGSSAMGDMLYANGNPDDYNAWEASGASGWSWDSVKQHFPVEERDDIPPGKSQFDYERELEDMVESKLLVSDSKSRLSRAFLSTGYKLNYSLYKLNTRSKVAFGPPLFTIKNGRRESSAKTYLSGLKTNKNVHIISYAFVKRVVIVNGTATGVEFDRFGAAYLANAKYEIILTAGAINSPAILQHSGIGPRKLLESLNITVVKDLAGVGHNLQDHYGTSLSFVVPKDQSVGNHFKHLDFLEILKYLIYSEGLLAQGPAISVGYINIDSSDSSSSSGGGGTGSQSTAAPNIQLVLRPYGMASDSSLLVKSAIGITDKLWQSYTPYIDGDQFAIDINLLHPDSRGSVRIWSPDPYQSPRIDPRYYSSPMDIQRMIRSVKWLKKFVNSGKFQQHLTVQAIGRPKQCDKYLTNVDKLNECFARHLTLTGHSPIGTCRMGDPTAATTTAEAAAKIVVDTELRVIGVNGLRVADASVMPSHVSGGPYAACTMIANRVADFILAKDKLFLKQVAKLTGDIIASVFQNSALMFVRYNEWTFAEKLLLGNESGLAEISQLAQLVPLFGGGG